MVKSVTEIKGSTDNHFKRLILSYEFPEFFKDFIVMGLHLYGCCKLLNIVLGLRLIEVLIGSTYEIYSRLPAKALINSNTN